jgi:predicted TIM-barrel fold metal-dependent hydrolase
MPRMPQSGRATVSVGTAGEIAEPAVLSRRQFLGSAALLATATTLPAHGDRYIDAHSHVWSGDTVRWPRVPIPNTNDGTPMEFSAEELLAHGQPSGVTRVVLIQRGFYLYDNRNMLDFMARYPGKFSGVARVDHTRPGPVEEMERLAGLGVRGFRILPNGEPATWLDSPAMGAMWACAGRRRLAMCPLVEPDAIPSIDRMARRHPDTPVVIDHLCRIGFDGQFHEADLKALCGLARQRQIKVKVSAFHALGRKQPPYLDLAPLIRRVFEAFGPQRLMWGTDSPFQVVKGNTYAASFGLIHDRLDFLSDSDRDWMLCRSAEETFFQ